MPPDPHLTNTNVPQVAVSDDSSESQRIPAFRFMDLPQELRDKVYEGLLCPHVDGTQYRRHENIRHYGLEPSILRTCKQVYEEASRVLYTKNGTVLIRFDAQAYQGFPVVYPRNYQRFPEVYSIVQVKCGKAGGEPVLTMEISVLEQYRTEPKRAKGKRAKGKFVPKKQGLFIGVLSDLPKICRFIVGCWSAKKLQLVVHMERLFGGSSESRRQMLSDCLECFREARGIGRAIILTEPQHSATAAKIADLMMTPMEYSDILSIVCAYEARAMRQLKGKQWNDARDTLQNALDFFDWQRYMHPRHDLKIREINVQWDYVSCCLKVGRTGDLHHQIRQMFRYCSPKKRTPAQQKGYWDRVADAHHAIGMAYVIDVALNSAAYSFLQALLTTPGHVQADRAIDDLEKQVKSSSNPEDVMARLTIECVLKEVRHQVPGQHRLTEDQLKNKSKGFRATYGEFQCLLRDSHGSSVSTIRVLAYGQFLV